MFWSFLNSSTEDVAYTIITEYGGMCEDADKGEMVSIYEWMMNA